MANKSVLGKGLASLIGGAPEASPVSGGKVVGPIGPTASSSGSIGPGEKKSAGPMGPTTIIDDEIAEKKEVLVKAKEEIGPMGPVLVDTSMIRPNQYQPRRKFIESELEELANSIKENGIIQPLIVSDLGGGKFELIAGERRLRAAERIGLKSVPVVVKRATGRERLVMAIIENVQRSDLNCVEEALAYHRLMEEFHLTQEEVARKVGKERSSVANFLRLLRLPSFVTEALQQGRLSFGHAKVLMGVKESTQIEFFARQVIDNGLSVRELEELIKKEGTGPRPLTRNPSPRDEKLEQLQRDLEKITGLHLKIEGKGSDNGQVIIKYHSKDEFNRIYDRLMQGDRR